MRPDVLSAIRRTARVVAVLTVPVAAPAAQQDTPRLDSGAVVRVWTRAGSLRGVQRLTMAGTRGDTLVLQEAGNGALWFVPLRDVDRLAVRTGRGPRGESARRGALIGLAVGAAPTVALLPFAIRADNECDACFIPATLVLGVLGTAFTTITTATGAIIGYNRPQERWRAVAPGRVRVGVGPSPEGGAVAVQLRF